MAKFVFRLQSFLNLKEKLEDQCRDDYGRAVAELELEKQRKTALESEREDRINRFSGMVRDRLSPILFADYNMYIEVLKQRIIEQQKVIDKAAEVAEQKRLLLVEAMKERKMLQTLKEKDLEEYKEEEKRGEQRLVDETVSYRFTEARAKLKG